MEDRSKITVPLLGEPAPSFKAMTTNGEINFPEDYKGKWVVFFSHPADFTPVCTTEFIGFVTIADELKAMNTELVGLSVDSLPAHKAWLRDIETLEYQGKKNVKIKFPLIEDIKMDVSNKYGMIQPAQANTAAVRAVFIVDPQGIIRLILYYPLTTGRNMDEIIRVLKALQKTDSDKVATPANWQPGGDVIVPGFDPEATPDPNVECVSWYLCLRKEK